MIAFRQWLFLALLATSVSVWANSWPEPTALETRHLLGPGHPGGATPVPLEGELYLLGMSPSNLAAFLEKKIGIAGQLSWRAWVQDLVTDNIVADQSWQDDASMDFSTWWSSHRDLVTRDFGKFQIVEADYQLGEFPVILDEEFDTAILRSTWSAQPESHISRLEVIVRSTVRGIKTIQDSSGDWQWATILGFLPSPYENRLALILLVQPRGWAGVSQPLRFLVTGASLKAGFEAP